MGQAISAAYGGNELMARQPFIRLAGVAKTYPSRGGPVVDAVEEVTVDIARSTNCKPGDGTEFGSLTLDEVFDDYFKPLNVPVFAGASFGHIRRKYTLPLGLEVEMDADAGTIRCLQPAVV